MSAIVLPEAATLGWYTLRAFGFSYFEVYTSPTGDGPYGWISKKRGELKYNAFYSDGTRKAAISTGSFRVARNFIVALAIQYQV